MSPPRNPAIHVCDCGKEVEDADWNHENSMCNDCHDEHVSFDECGCPRCYDQDGPFRGLDESYGQER